MRRSFASLAVLWLWTFPSANAAERVAAPLGISSSPVSGQAAAELGKLLFFDRRLSRDSSTNCATCHNPKLGWTDHRPTVLGIHEQLGERNAPSVLNAARETIFFWDGRASTLEEQAKEPIANPREMGFTLDEAAARIASISGYAPGFRAAFGDPRVTIDRIVAAIAAFERTIVAGNAPYDRFVAGDRKALSRPAKRGLALFNGKANCALCHSGPTFSDGRFHNIGVGMQRRVQDLGRFKITAKDDDRAAFKTPTLRNLTDTFPYMHDGSQASLEEVVDFFDRGGFPNQWLSREIKPLGLSPSEKKDLLAFLASLNGDKVIVNEPKEFPK